MYFASAVRGTGVGTASTLGRLFCESGLLPDLLCFTDFGTFHSAIVSPLIGAHILANTGLNDVLYVAGAPMVRISRSTALLVFRTHQSSFSLEWHCSACYCLTSARAMSFKSSFTIHHLQLRHEAVIPVIFILMKHLDEPYHAVGNLGAAFRCEALSVYSTVPHYHLYLIFAY